uniref:Uncharacterized protein n=1 Tax=Rhizophora mucronata TaxID=61149 RepID=A0A2P2JKH0_RHIMU
MVDSPNGCHFIDEFLPISCGFTQHLYCCKIATSKLAFIHRAISSFTQLVIEVFGHLLNIRVGVPNWH